jgi:hypothetical protein
MFVPLARQRADGSFDSARVWEREKQLGALVNKAFGPPNPGRPSAAVVEGRLGGRRVAGVLVWRQSSSEREDLVEKAVNALVSDAASGGPPTDVTCTAPVLERASIL